MNGDSVISSFLLPLFIAVGFAQMPPPTENNTESDLYGKWKAIGYYYQDHFIQPEDPKVILLYEFLKDGTDKLFWQYKGETTFCERKGLWFVFEGHLHDEVYWINPDNGMDCGADPDMQMGRVTQTYFWRDQNRLYIQIPLADEFLYYVWEIQEPEDLR